MRRRPSRACGGREEDDRECCQQQQKARDPYGPSRRDGADRIGDGGCHRPDDMPTPQEGNGRPDFTGTRKHGCCIIDPASGYRAKVIVTSSGGSAKGVCKLCGSAKWPPDGGQRAESTIIRALPLGRTATRGEWESGAPRRDSNSPTPRSVVWCSIQLSYGRNQGPGSSGWWQPSQGAGRD